MVSHVRMNFYRFAFYCLVFTDGISDWNKRMPRVAFIYGLVVPFPFPLVRVHCFHDRRRSWSRFRDTSRYFVKTSLYKLRNIFLERSEMMEKTLICPRLSFEEDDNNTEKIKISFRSVYIVEYYFSILELQKRDVNDSLIFLVAISSTCILQFFLSRKTAIFLRHCKTV